MFETQVTIAGNVVGDPDLRTTSNGRTVVNFRLASTPRRYNRAKETFEDSDTLWISVVCWNDLARNAAASLRKGDPVLVCGRLASREYVKDEQRRVNYEVTADSLGHNLTRGTSAFLRVNRAAGVTSVPVAEDGMPEDMTAELIELQLRQAEEQEAAYAGRGDTHFDTPERRDDVSEVQPLPNSGPLVSIG